MCPRINYAIRLKSTSAYPVKEYLEKKKSLNNKTDLIEFAATNDWRLTNKVDNGVLEYCLGYLIDKFKKISNNYMNHFYDSPNLSAQEFSEQIDELEHWRVSKTKDYLLVNSSHVTKKFDQTLNFIINQKTLIDKLDFLKDWDIHNVIEINENQLENWISVIEGDLNLKAVGTNEIISNLFPAIFNIDIEFENNGTPIKLSDMSSGERQHLFNINTITYHINNLKTIKPIENGKIKKYDHVNVILDEIELYYHPHYQKQLIKDITDEIKSLDKLGDLKNFNILFLTHSPFILSDIPKGNILKLVLNEYDKSEPQEMKEETFGANIHDLLANDFFLKNGFMGEFAKEKIESIIKGLTILINQKEIEKITYQYKSQPITGYVEIKLRHLKEELEFLKKQNKAIVTEAEINGILDLIGEPVLKKKIEQMKKIAFPS